MKNKQFILVCLVVLFTLLYSVRMSCAESTIAGTGNTVITAHNKKLKIKVEFVTARVKPPLYISEVEKRKMVTVIENMSILVNGKSLFVPFSVFADIIDPTVVSIDCNAKEEVLSIKGGDASEAFRLNIYFDSVKINRRALFDPNFPNEPMQETRYWPKVLKDQ